MKKILSAVLLSFVAAPLYAGAFGAELREESMVVNYTAPSVVNASTAAIVVDLSDSTNWPHKKTAAVNISAISLDVDKVSTSSGTVKLGVVTFVNASTGTVKFFFTKSFNKNVAKSQYETIKLESGLIRAKVDSNGLLPYILTNDADTGVTTYQTDVPLPTANGTSVAPAVGDIVLKVTNADGTNAMVAVAHVQYHTER